MQYQMAGLFRVTDCVGSTGASAFAVVGLCIVRVQDSERSTLKMQEQPVGASPLALYARS